MHFDWWTLALQTVNFAVLVWLLHRFLYRPVLRLVDARRAEVEQQYDAAKASAEAAVAERAAASAEQARTVAAREAALGAAAVQAEDAAKARRAQAEREAAELLEGARKTLAAEREHVLAEARQAALDLGVEMARRLLGELPDELRAAAWLPRIADHLAALPAAERDGLTLQLANGGALRVATAAPLSADAAARWRECLQRTLGARAVPVFEVDPALIAGAELRFPSAVLRVTWQNALGALRAEVEAHGAAD